MTTVNLISKKGDSKQADMAFPTLINVPMGGTIEIRVGTGFQLPKQYKKVSDYTFQEV